MRALANSDRDIRQRPLRAAGGTGGMDPRVKCRSLRVSNPRCEESSSSSNR